MRGNKLPKGAITVIGSVPINSKQIPGIRLSQIAVSFGIGIQYVILLSFVYRLIFGFEEYNFFFILELPIEVYWIGIIGMWLLGVWVSITFIYNVNYTACFNQMKEEEYALATGGTYKYVRHPAYIAGVFEIIFIFLGTGIWFMFFGLIGFLALLYQAKGEEKMLQEMFGEVYEEYASRTGRFFPKIKRINKK
ncbi:MAG: isoprenylcysteine carboxylmethyltransferase family protein [Candidatus Lokiarchaeota archaeon]|nr:isoprenylcysteine carboxylmethyltransferase family protein [Candidatus Lokiarchaeota archaeon]